jgi:hypothetical protein
MCLDQLIDHKSRCRSAFEPKIRGKFPNRALRMLNLTYIKLWNTKKEKDAVFETSAKYRFAVKKLESDLPRS